MTRYVQRFAHWKVLEMEKGFKYQALDAASNRAPLRTKLPFCIPPIEIVIYPKRCSTHTPMLDLIQLFDRLLILLK
jgi:hypothetical protein